VKYGRIVKKKDPNGREYNVLTLDANNAVVLPDGQVSMSRADIRRMLRIHAKRQKAIRQAKKEAEKEARND
jgi:hypothetical protein